jgi:two-component system sensor histidine kinase UhpB
MKIQDPKILLIEDNLSQAKLVKNVLDKSSMEYCLTHVTSGEEGLDLLKNANEFDIVLLDYSLPEMNGLDVLRNIKKMQPELPVIITTGHGSEDIAVQIMKEGAFDYVIKKEDYIERIPYVIKESLQQCLFEKEKIKLESQLRESDERYRNLFETSLDGIIILNPETKILSANPASIKISGYSLEELSFLNLNNLFRSAEGQKSFQEVLRENETQENLEFELISKDKKIKTVLISFAHIKASHAEGKPISCFIGIGVIFKDITERKLAEKRIEELLEESKAKSKELERANKMLENYITGRRSQI